MAKNLRKFSSTAEYENYKATDGWDYPSVCFVETSFENQIYYNNEFIMRWNDNDTAPVPTFSGSISLADFKEWVDNASCPCEIGKDGQNFNYLLLTNYEKTASDYTGTTLLGDSHYKTEDKADYLQMTEIENVNVGLFKDSKKGIKEVRFNFDKGCPKGFHKWFAHPYWNEERGCYTKLIGRYNTTPAGTNTSATAAGINCAFGLSQGGSNANNYTLGSWNANLLLAATKATMAEDSGCTLLQETYWEHVVLSYIFSAYYETFNHQSIFYGHATDYNTAENPNNPTGAGAGAGLNGHTDSLLMPHGTTVSNPSTTNGGYRFMHIENAIHGQQWIWGAGCREKVTSTEGTYYMTYDDVVANKIATLAFDDADVIGKFAAGSSVNNKFISKIDLLAMPTEVNGTSSTGFCDAIMVNGTGADRIAYVGGYSNFGSSNGGFARLFNLVATHTSWTLRGRVTMNR